MLTQYTILDDTSCQNIETQRFTIYQNYEIKIEQPENHYHSYYTKLCDNGKYLVDFNKQNIEIKRLNTLQTCKFRFQHNLHYFSKLIIMKDIFFLMMVDKYGEKNEYYLSMYIHDLRLHHNKYTQQILRIQQHIIDYWVQYQQILVQIANLTANAFYLCIPYYQIKKINKIFSQPEQFTEVQIKLYRINFSQKLFVQLSEVSTWRTNYNQIQLFEISKHHLFDLCQISQIISREVILIHMINYQQITITQIAINNGESIQVKHNAFNLPLISQFYTYLDNKPLRIQISLIQNHNHDTNITNRQIITIIYQKQCKTFLIFRSQSRFNYIHDDKFLYKENSVIIHHIRPIQQLMLSSVGEQFANYRGIFIISKNKQQYKNILTIDKYSDVHNFLYKQFPKDSFQIFKIETDYSINLQPINKIGISKTNQYFILSDFFIFCVDKHNKFKKISWLYQKALFPEIPSSWHFMINKYQSESQSDQYDHISVNSSQYQYNQLFQIDDQIANINNKYQQSTQNDKDQVRKLIQNRYTTTFQGIFDIKNYLQVQGQFRIQQVLQRILFMCQFGQNEGRYSDIYLLYLQNILEQIINIGKLMIGEILTNNTSNNYLLRVSTICNYELKQFKVVKHNLLKIFIQRLQKQNKNKAYKFIQCLSYIFDRQIMQTRLRNQERSTGLSKKNNYYLFQTQNNKFRPQYYSTIISNYQVHPKVHEFQQQYNNLQIKSVQPKIQELNKNNQLQQLFIKYIQQPTIIQFNGFINQIKNCMKQLSQNQSDGMSKYIDIFKYLWSIYLMYEQLYKSEQSLITQKYGQNIEITNKQHYQNFLREYDIDEKCYSYQSRQINGPKNHMKIQYWAQIGRQQFIQVFKLLKKISDIIKLPQKIQKMHIEMLQYIHHYGVLGMPAYPRSKIIQIIYKYRKEIRKFKLLRITQILSHSNQIQK